MVFILADESADRVWQGLVGALSGPDTLWTVDSADCIYDEGLRDGIFTPGELRAALAVGGVCFARLFAMPGGRRLEGDVKTHADVRACGCEALVICTDCAYLEVFSQNADLLERAAQAARAAGAERVSMEPDEDRTDFRI